MNGDRKPLDTPVEKGRLRTGHSPTWSTDQLHRLQLADELEIATWRLDGTLRPWVPIWVVNIDTGVYVRTWHRRATGWFGHAVNTGRARIRVPGLDTDVDIEDIGSSKSALRRTIDEAYRAKYRHHDMSAVESMTTDNAANTTLSLLRPPS